MYMQSKYIAPEFLQPTSLSQLAQMMIRRPRALLVGGGVYVFADQDCELLSLPPEVIFLNQITELLRLTHNEYFLEIGSSVTLQRLLDQAVTYLPCIALKILRQQSNLAIRNQATIGGTLAIPSYRSDLFAVFSLLDATVEIRKFTHKFKRGKSIKIPLIRLVRDGFLDLNNDEIITTVRLSLIDWTHWHSVKLFYPFTADNSGFLILLVARVEKGIILDFRMMSLVNARYLVYDYAFDAYLVGRRYPILSKELSPIYHLIEELLDREEYFLSDYVKYTIREVVLSFIQGFTQES